MRRSERKQLQKEYAKVYGDMMNYLSYKRLNGLALQAIQTEIYGICLAHQAHQEQPEAVFGDYRKFCDEICANALRQSRQETRFYTLAIIAGATSLVLCIVTIIASIKPFMGTILYQGELYITWIDFLPLLLGYANALLLGYVTLKKKFQKTGKALLFTLLFCVGMDVCIFYGSAAYSDRTFRLPVYPLIFLFFAMTLLFAFRYHRSSKEHFMRHDETYGKDEEV